MYRPDQFRLNYIVVTVLFCHFLSSFTILGMPLFFPKIMEDFLSADQQLFIGWFYVLPTIAAAIASPLWGRFADRYGKHLSLMRAQIGLVIGFVVAGIAPNIWVFAAGLIIQGACGGTFAASNAYLASQVSASELSRTLNLTQFSARLSLLVAPILLGVLISIEKPLTLYCYLACLPLCAVLAISRLPRGECVAMPRNNKIISNRIASRVSLSFNRILIIKFLFSFSVVVSFPYFYSYAIKLGASSDTLIGVYFSLPHLMYLILIALKSDWQKVCSAAQLVSAGLAALLIASFLQYAATDTSLIILLRLLMGLGLSLTYIGLHQGVAELKSSRAGLMFGRFDSASKWAGVVAGFIAGIVIQYFELNSPFFISALGSGFALIVLITARTKNVLKEQQYVG